MQTLTIQVKDDLVEEVINALEKFEDNVKITKDKNLALDPYFYERQKKLQKILDDESETITHSELWDKVHKHLEKIQAK